MHLHGELFFCHDTRSYPSFSFIGYIVLKVDFTFFNDGIGS